ncbi:MAG: biotin-dependent carboxyltransferase family protein [Candidatus Eiseniibacteriota bacterium]
MSTSGELLASTLVVEKPGMLTTVQDLGRDRLGRLGVSPSGAADPLSLVIGNRLVGNPDGAAALELTLTGGTFAFPHGALIALAGSDFGASVGGASLPPWRSHVMMPGAVLEIGATRGGARAYLCVAGGIRVTPVMGSASTHLLSALGGFQGRALRKGDVIPLGSSNDRRASRRLPAALSAASRSLPAALSAASRSLPAVAFAALAGRAFDPPGAPKTLRVTDGPQSEHFSPRTWSVFLESPFTVSEESNRMGLRLSGPGIATRMSGEMISEGVSLGAIQITPAGQPIVLFVEQQTAGGYPKIANVIGADLFRLGQLRPRDQIRFELVSIEQARALLKAQRGALTALLEPIA